MNRIGRIRLETKEISANVTTFPLMRKDKKTGEQKPVLGIQVTR